MGGSHNRSLHSTHLQPRTGLILAIYHLPELVCQHTWSTGRSVTADLHQEHLNQVRKYAIQGVGINKSEKAITRIGKPLGTLFPVLSQFDEQNHCDSGSDID